MDLSTINPVLLIASLMGAGTPILLEMDVLSNFRIRLKNRRWHNG